MAISGGYSPPVFPAGRPDLALFGGAFNPIHLGHIALAAEIEGHLGLKRILFIPTGEPPHKDPPDVSCGDRIAMVTLAISGHSGWDVTDIECRTPGPSYTARTIDLLNLCPSPFFVMGSDAFVDFWDWGDPERILSRTHLVVVNRPGAVGDGVWKSLRTILEAAQTPVESDNHLHPSGVFTPPEAGGRDSLREIVWSLPLFGTTLRFLRIDSPPVSSTELRRFLSENRHGIWKNLLPEPVKSYIVERGLYAGNSGIGGVRAY